jgi:hypothetical protein
MNLKEDNNGFVNFPFGRMFNKIDSGKTFVYLVAFDPSDVSNTPYELSNLRLLMPGLFVSDDINGRINNNVKISIDELVKNKIKDDAFNSFYFPNGDSNVEIKKIMSIPMTTCICIGWSDSSYELRDSDAVWAASFRELSNEGKKLYYSIKKLHNNKEVRILTFNNI